MLPLLLLPPPPPLLLLPLLLLLLLPLLCATVIGAVWAPPTPVQRSSAGRDGPGASSPG